MTDSKEVADARHRLFAERVEQMCERLGEAKVRIGVTTHGWSEPKHSVAKNWLERREQMRTDQSLRESRSERRALLNLIVSAIAMVAAIVAAVAAMIDALT